MRNERNILKIRTQIQIYKKFTEISLFAFFLHFNGLLED